MSSLAYRDFRIDFLSVFHTLHEGWIARNRIEELSIEPNALWINADATGGSLRVEIVDPFDRVVPGFGKEDCIPFSANETEYRVQWKSDPQGAVGDNEGGLEEKMVSQARGGLNVKVYLDRARLYALYAS